MPRARWRACSCSKFVLHDPPQDGSSPLPGPGPMDLHHHRMKHCGSSQAFPLPGPRFRHSSLWLCLQLHQAIKRYGAIQYGRSRTPRRPCQKPAWAPGAAGQRGVAHCLVRRRASSADFADPGASTLRRRRRHGWTPGAPDRDRPRLQHFWRAQPQRLVAMRIAPARGAHPAPPWDSLTTSPSTAAPPVAGCL